jgi:hypothetical protein
MKKIIAAVFLILLLTPKDAWALNKVFSVPQGDFFIQTSSGKTITETVLVKSGSSAVVKIRSSWQGYTLTKEALVNDSFLNQHSIDFAVIDQTNFEIQPFGTNVINVNLSVPDQIKSGDYYGVLALTDGQNEEKVNFTLRVLGQVSEKITLEGFQKDSSGFKLKVANEGNITTKLKAKLKVSDFVGKIDELETGETSVKAGQITTLEASLKQLLPGYYQAEVSLIFGDKLTQTTSVHSFWVWPEFFLGSLIVAVLVLLVIVVVKKKATHV